MFGLVWAASPWLSRTALLLWVFLQLLSQRKSVGSIRSS
jgi:hypothetical protein